MLTIILFLTASFSAIGLSIGIIALVRQKPPLKKLSSQRLKSLTSGLRLTADEIIKLAERGLV